jgi:hypothetical protein
MPNGSFGHIAAIPSSSSSSALHTTKYFFHFPISYFSRGNYEYDFLHLIGASAPLVNIFDAPPMEYPEIE